MHKLTRPSSVPSPLIGVPPPQDGSVAWESHWRTHPGQKAVVQLDLLCMQNELCAYCESKLEMHEDLRVARKNQVQAYKWLESYPADEIDKYLDSLPRSTPHITAIYHYFNRRVA